MLKMLQDNGGKWPRGMDLDDLDGATLGSAALAMFTNELLANNDHLRKVM